MASPKNRYTQIIEQLFAQHYQGGALEVPFGRSDIEATAARLAIPLPKNIGDVLYTFRYRAALPDTISSKAPQGFEWLIRPAGRARYKFVLVRSAVFVPNAMLAKTKILDATPGIISQYTLNDEQALLARIRYNRLVDIFTGVTCYSLQSHLRTTLAGIGQVETDEIYVGMDKNGVHYVFPVQAKGEADRIGAVQIEQDILLCAEKFADAIGRPIAAQFIDDQTVALFEFVQTEEGIRIASEKHYQLVTPDALSVEELQSYRQLSE